MNKKNINNCIDDTEKNKLKFNKLKKYSQYIIGESCSNSYIPVIVPDSKSGYFEYDPFNEFPYILKDFISMILGMDEKNIFTKGRNLDQYIDMDLLNNFKDDVLPFIQKYGLLGTYYKNIDSLKKVMKTDDTFELRIAYKESKTYQLSDLDRYSSYAQCFLDRATYSKNNVDDYGLFNDEFIGDNVYFIYQDIYEFRNMIIIWNEFSNNLYSADELISKNVLPYIDQEKYRFTECIPRNKSLDTIFKWRLILESELRLPVVEQYINCDLNKPASAYKFSSLLDVLKIMFVQNVVFDQEKFQICHYKNCLKPFQPKRANQICCSNSCNNAYRQQKYRDKNKVEKMILQGISLPEIAQKMDIGLQYIDDLLKTE